MASAISGDFGDAVLILMKSPVFADLPIKALRQTVLEPMDRGQLFIARGKNEKGQEHPVAMLSVAKLSDELHEKMLSDPSNTALEGDDWASGNNIWFLYADGPGDFLGQFLKQVRDEHFGGEDVWLRGRGDDGSPAARKLSK